MAGTVVADTLKDGSANQLSVTRIVKGAAAAWVKFAGATGAIDKSYNVTSVTRNGTGDYTINFTNAMTDTGYVFTGSVGSTSGSALYGLLESTTTARTTSAIRFFAIPNSGTPGDFNPVSAAIFGN